jgi:hypothetical protein
MLKLHRPVRYVIHSVDSLCAAAVSEILSVRLSSCSIYRFCCWSSNCSSTKENVICACVFALSVAVKYGRSDVESAAHPTESSYSIVRLVLSEERPSRRPVDRRAVPSPTPTNHAHAMAAAGSAALRAFAPRLAVDAEAGSGPAPPLAPPRGSPTPVS